MLLLQPKHTFTTIIPFLQYVCKRCTTDLGKTKGKDLGSAEAYVRSIFDDAASDGDSEEDSDSESESDESDGDASEEEDDDADIVEDVLAEEATKPTKGNSKSAMHKGLKNAVLFGLFPGSTPEELSDLTWTEVSMIALVNSLTKLHICKKQSYFEATSPTYTIYNNVNSIAEQLPRKPSPTEAAILRTTRGKVPKDYTFRPYYVIRALRWLKENNRLYANVQIVIPKEWRQPDGELVEEALPVDTIELSEEESNDVEHGDGAVDHTNHSGHEAGGTATDLLLLTDFDQSSNMDILQDALDDKVEDRDESPISVDDLVTLIVERGGQAEFTDASKQEALLEMSFPQFFPYGRGGPADSLSKWLTLSRTARVNKFAKTALSSGAHYRRLQNNFNFLSLCYYTSIRKRMAGKLQVVYLHLI